VPSHRPTPRRALAIAPVLFCVIGFCLRTPALIGASEPPKLVVMIVVDQMRADYVDRFQDAWSGGFKRLLTEGAWLRRAAYPYLETVTCAGHATIMTGAFPHTHGISQNAWWDRELHKQVTCTEDPHLSNVRYAAPVTGGDSPNRLKMTTLTDALRSERRAHVATVAVKEFVFKEPVQIGDVLSFYAEVERIGNTSITVTVEVFAERRPSDPTVVKVTEATLTYVAIDRDGRPRPVPRS